jgi:hypothetical protein
VGPPALEIKKKELSNSPNNSSSEKMVWEGVPEVTILLLKGEIMRIIKSAELLNKLIAESVLNGKIKGQLYIKILDTKKGYTQLEVGISDLEGQPLVVLVPDQILAKGDTLNISEVSDFFKIHLD